MAFIPAPATVEAVIKFTWNSVPNKCYVHHLRWVGVGAITFAALDDLSGAIYQWLDTSMQPIVANRLTFTGLRLTSLETEAAPVLDMAFTPTLTGALGDESTSGQVAIAVHKNTGLRGRSRNGRVYHVGITEAQHTANTLDSAAAALILNAWEEMRDYTEPMEFVPAICSFTENGAPRTTALTTAITSYSLIDLRLDTNRNRMS